MTWKGGDCLRVSQAVTYLPCHVHTLTGSHIPPMSCVDMTWEVGDCLGDTQTHRTTTVTQVNEQANAGLQQIRGQLAYINFMFTVSLFLNMDKRKKIDISTVIYVVYKYRL